MFLSELRANTLNESLINLCTNPARMNTHLRNVNMERTREDLKKAVTPDLFIVQTVHTIDELEKTLNTFTTLLRERYGYYAPKHTKHDDLPALLTTIAKKEIEPLGVAVKEEDYTSVRALADATTRILTLSKEQETYLDTLMHTHCPHLRTIAGTLLGARLLAHAGSLYQLAILPSSTIQLLGAEKALFRHLKTGAKPPRFGIIFSHENVTKANEDDRGKAARQLASKISIATKQDYFKQ